MKHILVSGAVAFDYIMDFSQSFEENIIPQKLKTLSISFLVKNLSRNFGGSAGNIAYNLGLLKQNPVLFACTGKKDSKAYEKHIKKAGVNTDFVNVIKNEFTATVFLITDKNNCQIAAFNPASSNFDSLLKIEGVHKVLKIDFLVISPTTPEAIIKFAKDAVKLKIPYLYDPAQQIPTISANELKIGIEKAEILICNDYELSLIMKKTKFDKKQILSKVKILITTLGEKGSLVETKSERLMINAAKPRKVVDPTGAGDAYIAGFLTGYLNNQLLKICGQIGSTISTFAIEEYGTQKHKPTIEQVKQRYKMNFKENLEF